ncbi:MAG: DUF1801 domain-containing protein [Rubricoccaceae bacterium]
MRAFSSTLKPHPPLTHEGVVAAFERYPPAVREKLLRLRQLVLDTAATTEGVGTIEETLKWGEPSYVTRAPKSGTTVRLASVRGTDDRVGLFVNCQTTLIGTFRQMYPDRFTFDGTRAITFHVDEPIPTDELRHCIALALCYHLDKR